MSKPNNIYVKGNSPVYKYKYNLMDEFSLFGDKVFCIGELINHFENDGINLTEKGLFEYFFSYRKNQGNIRLNKRIFDHACPFQMKSVLETQFLFNLDFQDTIIKIELERSKSIDFDITDAAARNIIVKKLLTSVTKLLKTKFFSEEPVFLELTNAELDFLVLKCLMLYNIINETTYEQLVKTGNLANEISFLVQSSILNKHKFSIDDLLLYMIYSGVIWWSEIELQEKFLADRNNTISDIVEKLTGLCSTDMAVNHFDEFKSEVLNSHTNKNILFFADDNGELVWDILFLKKILESNSNLHITCVVNSIPILNNSNTFTLKNVLQKYFSELLYSNRFVCIEEKWELPAFDLRFASNDILNRILESDFIVTKGASFFEKFQYMPVPTYYMFTVYGRLSSILTGLDKYSGIFVRGLESDCCYKIKNLEHSITTEINLKNYRLKQSI